MTTTLTSSALATLPSVPCVPTGDPIEMTSVMAVVPRASRASRAPQAPVAPYTSDHRFNPRFNADPRALGLQNPGYTTINPNVTLDSQVVREIRMSLKSFNTAMATISKTALQDCVIASNLAVIAFNRVKIHTADAEEAAFTAAALATSDKAKEPGCHTKGENTKDEGDSFTLSTEVRKAFNRAVEASNLASIEVAKAREAYRVAVVAESRVNTAVQDVWYERDRILEGDNISDISDVCDTLTVGELVTELCRIPEGNPGACKALSGEPERDRATRVAYEAFRAKTSLRVRAVLDQTNELVRRAEQAAKDAVAVLSVADEAVARASQSLRDSTVRSQV